MKNRHLLMAIACLIFGILIGCGVVLLVFEGSRGANSVHPMTLDSLLHRASIHDIVQEDPARHEEILIGNEHWLVFHRFVRPSVRQPGRPLAPGEFAGALYAFYDNQYVTTIPLEEHIDARFAPSVRQMPDEGLAAIVYKDPNGLIYEVNIYQISKSKTEMSLKQEFKAGYADNENNAKTTYFAFSESPLHEPLIVKMTENWTPKEGKGTVSGKVWAIWNASTLRFSTID